MEAVQTTVTSVNSYQSTRCYNPEDSHLHGHRSENLKSHREINNLGIIVYIFFVQTTDNIQRKCAYYDFQKTLEAEGNIAWTASNVTCHGSTDVERCKYENLPTFTRADMSGLLGIFIGAKVFPFFTSSSPWWPCSRIQGLTPSNLKQGAVP
jgi:hypothetical protein